MFSYAVELFVLFLAEEGIKVKNPKITRFEPHGPADTGMEEWDPIDPAGLEAGKPVQRGHLYDEESKSGYMVGVWDCTAMTEKFGPYGVNEFMFLLEGSVTMIEENGNEVTISAGESFVLPQGLPCQWKQEGYLRKFFMIYEDSSGQTPENPSELKVILPQPSGPSDGMKEVENSDPSIFIGEVPTQHNHTYFEDMTEQMTVGLWDSTPFECAVTPFSQNELIYLLEGSVILTDGEGKPHQFQAGETIYIPKGTLCGWKNTEYVRKIYATFQ